MSNVTLDEAKLYLRVDADVEDSLINSLIAASESYLKGAVTDYDKKVTDTDFQNRAKIAQLALITQMYENRDNADAPHDYSYCIRSLINQMQYDDVPQAGDSS